MSCLNLLLSTDVYKLGHMEQYPEDVAYIYSYLTARSGKKYKDYPFYGLQYYIKQYLNKKITHEDVDQLLTIRKEILGVDLPEKHVKQLRELVNLGYLPIKIKAVPEGTIVKPGNVVMTIENTKPGFGWLVGFLESLLLKLWYPCTVAAASRKYRQLIDRMADKTSDRDFLRPFLVHDFGYRGVSSEESAAIAGSAHLLNFLGTDTVPAIQFVHEYYNHRPEDGPIGLSVPASEHSVMCSYGKENELDAYKNMLNLYPTGIVSIVSDTYNLWDVLTEILPTLHDQIVSREGKVVIRPDSGDPAKILLGDPDAEDPRARLGVFALLEKEFGTTPNSKGFKVLHPSIGVIYGDGMYYDRFEQILEGMTAQNYATDNLVIGVGGLLLQQHNRDDLGFSLKATHLTKKNGEEVKLFKDPVTDSGKKSHTGRMVLVDGEAGLTTVDDLSKKEQANISWDMLQLVFENNLELGVDTTFNDIRARVGSV